MEMLPVATSMMLRDVTFTIEGTAKLTVLGPEYPAHVDSKLPQHFSKTQRNAV
jgi:hypothetical protein